LATEGIPGIENAGGSSSNTRIHTLMTCIIMYNDENLINLLVSKSFH